MMKVHTHKHKNWVRVGRWLGGWGGREEETEERRMKNCSTERNRRLPCLPQDSVLAETVTKTGSTLGDRSLQRVWGELTCKTYLSWARNLTGAIPTDLSKFSEQWIERHVESLAPCWPWGAMELQSDHTKLRAIGYCLHDHTLVLATGLQTDQQSWSLAQCSHRRSNSTSSLSPARHPAHHLRWRASSHVDTPAQVPDLYIPGRGGWANWKEGGLASNTSQGHPLILNKNTLMTLWHVTGSCVCVVGVWNFSPVFICVIPTCSLNRTETRSGTKHVCV